MESRLYLDGIESNEEQAVLHVERSLMGSRLYLEEVECLPCTIHVYC